MRRYVFVRPWLRASSQAGLHKGGPGASKGLGLVLVDVNGDGKPDIYVANDTVDNFLYVNNCRPGARHGTFKFREVGLVSGTARDDRGGGRRHCARRDRTGGLR